MDKQNGRTEKAKGTIITAEREREREQSSTQILLQSVALVLRSSRSQNISFSLHKILHEVQKLQIDTNTTLSCIQSSTDPPM